MSGLTKQKIADAESAAKDVIKEIYGSVDAIELPIDLNIAIEAYGLTIKKGSFKDGNVSGAYDKQSSTIYISENESTERQAFTVAHELGHFKLHDDVETDVLYRTQVFQFGNTLDVQEKAANWFAASLLMPKEAVERLWNTTKDVGALAQIFGVSRSAMYFRLKNLGLVG